MSDALTKLKQAVLEGDDATAAATAQQALAEGLKGLDIVNSAIVPGIQAAGQLWKENQYFLPDVVMSAEAFSAAMAVVQPTLTAEGARHTGRVLIGTDTILDGTHFDLARHSLRDVAGNRWP